MTKEQALEKQYEQAVSRLEEVMKEEKSEFIRDAAILRFEFTFDLSWKYLKKYLYSEKNIVCMSPNDCFREAYHQGIVQYEDKWIDMAKQRNEAVHTYKENLAEQLYGKLPEFLEFFKELQEVLKK